MGVELQFIHNIIQGCLIYFPPYKICTRKRKGADFMWKWLKHLFGGGKSETGGGGAGAF
jgi:hypothetical protein